MFLLSKVLNIIGNIIIGDGFYMPKVTEIYQGVSTDNKQTILKFCKDMELLDLSEQTIYNYKFNLIKLGRFLKGITYKRATKDEIKSFFVFLKETKYSSAE